MICGESLPQESVCRSAGVLGKWTLPRASHDHDRTKRSKVDEQELRNHMSCVPEGRRAACGEVLW